jgi:outer membrane protein, heavy metal efflux system
VDLRTLIVASALLTTSTAALAAAQDRPTPARTDSTAAGGPAATIVASIADPPLAHLVNDVLERNPCVASLGAKARAAEQKAPQARALPDPMASLTLFLLPPETRVGPQQGALGLSQKLPWFGKLKLAEKAAVLEAAATWSRVSARRLELVTETRRLYYELAFLDAWARVVREDRATLGHYEELARARYASGVGLEQGVVKIQAEITRDDTRLLEIASRRATLLAQVNALRDRPESTPLEVTGLPTLPQLAPDEHELSADAMARRPELAGAQADVERSATMIQLAKKAYKPDVTLGLNYTPVGTRTDLAGRQNPPQDNGQDILGVSAGVNLPIWRAKLTAGVEEATANRLAAEEAKRAVAAGIEQSLGDLTSRIPLIWDRLRLLDDVLSRQAEQSLRSAESAYAAGTLNALDLLDAERVLLEVRIAGQRARADYAVALAQLDGAVAGNVASTTGKEEQ